jgi:hypothetical protein
MWLESRRSSTWRSSRDTAPSRASSRFTVDLERVARRTKVIAHRSSRDARVAVTSTRWVTASSSTRVRRGDARAHESRPRGVATTMRDASTARARRDESSARTLVAHATDVDAFRSPRATRCDGEFGRSRVRRCARSHAIDVVRYRANDDRLALVPRVFTPYHW